MDDIILRMQHTNVLNINREYSYDFSYNDEDWYNNTNYDLHVVSNSESSKVFSKTYIPSNIYLGTIVGKQTYIWDVVEVSPFIININDELVIDATETPRCILSMIRSGFELGLAPNCKIVTDINELTGMCTVGMISIKDIQWGEELIY